MTDTARWGLGNRTLNSAFPQVFSGDLLQKVSTVLKF